MSRSSRKFRQQRSVRLYEDILFIERAERLMNFAINGDSGFLEIADLFRKGYPIENLNRILDENNEFSAQFIGIEVCCEIRKIAIPCLDKVAELMDRDDRLTMYYDGIEWLADYADETNELADWVILSSIESKYKRTAVTAMKILSDVNFSQLRGAKAYLLKNILNSPHISGIDFCLNYYDDKNSIINLLNNQNIIMQKYAVALASRFFSNDIILRDKVQLLKEETIEMFVQEKIQQRENLLRMFR
jgi:hypothetical protein